MSQGSVDVEGLADALVILGRATGALSEMEEDYAAFMALSSQEQDIGRFMSDPAVLRDGRESALEDMFKGRMNGVLLRFLQVVAGAGWFSKTRDIGLCFLEKCSNLRNKRSGELVSAVPLLADQIREIEETSGRILGYDVSLKARTDSSLLGGFIVRVGDFVIDNSLNQQLDVIRDTLGG